MRARWVLPVAGAPIENGVVDVEAGRIQSVGRWRGGHSKERVLDLGDAVLLPALVNAHTHLEFSDLPHRIGKQGNSLPDWIRQVIAWRQSNASAGPPPGLAPIERGLRQAASLGTGLVGEIATRNWAQPATDLGQLAHWTEELAVEVCLFWERLGSRPMDIEQRTAEIDQFWVSQSPSTAWQPGLSPHAPYSTHRLLVEHCVRHCRQKRWPLAMHIAECEEEIQFLDSASGPFAEMLDAMGIPLRDDGFGSLEQLARCLLQAPRVLWVHANFLDETCMDLLASAGAGHSVVYCPRTHQYFQHPRHPLMSLHERGIRVALGTDSLASNPDLDVLEEARCVRSQFRELPPEKILEMATLSGAQALGREKHWGSLERGKRAHFAVIPLAADALDSPWQILECTPDTTTSNRTVIIRDDGASSGKNGFNDDRTMES